MTSYAEAIRERSGRIADLVVERARELADSENPREWTERRGYDEFVAMLRSVDARVDDTDRGPVVVVWPRLRPNDARWSGTTLELLDTAIGRADDAAGDTFTFDSAQIDRAEGSYESRLVWKQRQSCAECGAGPDEDCLTTLQGACPGSLV